ncbi:hypothetical protein Aduo_018793 [Ancylostoma duodenale]
MHCCAHIINLAVRASLEIGAIQEPLKMVKRVAAKLAVENTVICLKGFSKKNPNNLAHVEFTHYMEFYMLHDPRLLKHC